MADPLSLTTGIISLITLAIKLVVGAAGLIDKTVAAHRGAANELEDLQRDLERLEGQMDQIHGTLQLLVTNTKDRAFKKLLQDGYGNIAVRGLCSALDETFAVLERLTDRAESEKTNLQSIALPANERSLAYVQAILKHNFSPSKVADLVNNLKSMQSEVRACLEKLQGAFGHVNNLYSIIDNRLMRVTTSTSVVSTSTMLTARIKLAGWLKRREGTWGLSSRSRSTTLYDFLATDHVTGTSRMPPNVLSKTLRHLCNDGPLRLRHLLFASREFYYAAISDAYLWTTIFFDAEFFSHFEGRPVKQANSFIKHCLLRSSALPLCLHIKYDGLETYDFRFLLGPLKIFRDSKYRGFERCNSLLWYHDPLSSDTLIEKVVALLPKELPSLHHISLSRLYDPMDGSRFPNCPVLERVEMFGPYYPYPPFCGRNFARVTTLFFSNNTGWRNRDITTLSIFPALRDLTLVHMGRGEASIQYDFQDDSQSPIEYQHLHVLRIHGNILPEVLTKLVAPALKELHIETNIHGRTSIAALCNSLEPLCISVYASLPETVSAEEPDWAIDLKKLVRKCAKIETLHVSEWMEEESQKIVDGSNIVVHVR